MTKRKINLLAIAKQSEKDYEEIELTLNGEVFATKVYKVPNPVAWTYKPSRPEPTLPTRLMRPDVAGRQQRVVIKEGDEGWNEYQSSLADYENESENIQNGVRYVLALADMDYPDLSNAPPLAKRQGIEYPDDKILQKKMWLDYTIFLEQSNLMAVQAAMMKNAVGTVTDESVEGVKKNSGSNSETDQSAK